MENVSIQRTGKGRNGTGSARTSAISFSSSPRWRSNSPRVDDAAVVVDAMSSARPDSGNFWFEWGACGAMRSGRLMRATESGRNGWVKVAVGLSRSIEFPSKNASTRFRKTRFGGCRGSEPLTSGVGGYCGPGTYLY